MEQIKIQALIVPARDVPGDFISYTTYILCGQGSSVEEAKNSTVSVVENYLDFYARNTKPLPHPEVQISSIDDVVNYFSSKILPGTIVVKDNVETINSRNRLPILIFDFYKVQ